MKRSPEYDYTDDTTVCLICFEDGCESVCTIPDLKGNPSVLVHAKREGNVMNVWTEGEKVGFKYQILGDEELEIVTL